MRKIETKNSKRKIKKNSSQEDSFSEADINFSKSTKSAMNDEVLEFDSSQDENEMDRESERNDLENEDSEKPAPALQDLYEILNLK